MGQENKDTKRVAREKREVAFAEARRIYREKTYEEWKKYMTIRKPAEEAWECFQLPFFKEMQAAYLKADKEYDREIGG